MNIAKFGFWALIIAAPVVSRAAVIYSNFGAGQTYNTSVGNLVGNDTLGDNLAEADTFTPSSTYTFTSLDIALSCEFSGACSMFGIFEVEIVANLAGGGPDTSTILANFLLPASTLPTFGGNNTPLQLNWSGGTVTLAAGTQYWIVVLSDTSNKVEWNLNSTGDTSSEQVAFAGGTPGDTWYDLGQTPGAYDIIGTPTGGVPEPGTLGLMLGGGLLLGLLKLGLLKKARS